MPWQEFSQARVRANGYHLRGSHQIKLRHLGPPTQKPWIGTWNGKLMLMVNSLIAREDLDSEMTVCRKWMERG